MSLQKYDRLPLAVIDATLTTPSGSIMLLFTDIGSAATGGQKQMQLFLNDNNWIPPAYTVLKGVGFQPEFSSKPDQLKGISTNRTWTLTLYNDLNNASGATLNTWSLEILEDLTPDPTTLSTAYTTDFEANDNGFTHSGTGDQWARCTPKTPAAIGNVCDLETAGDPAGSALNIISTVNPAGGTYAWYRNGHLLTSPLQQGAVLSNMTVNELGTYRLVYKDMNGCVNTSADVVVLGLASYKLWVYPVPNNGSFQVRFFNQTGEQATVRVFDDKGSKLYERAVVTTFAYTPIIVNFGLAIADAVYLVELVIGAGKRIGVKKIVVREKP